MPTICFQSKQNKGITLIYLRNKTYSPCLHSLVKTSSVKMPTICFQSKQNKGVTLIYLRNKTYSQCLQSRRTFGIIQKQISKIRDAVLKEFHLLEKSHKICRGFHQPMKARRTCFLYKIIILRVKKKNDHIRSTYV